MTIYDLHCDALLKLWEDRTRGFLDHPSVEANFQRLQKGKVKLQLFAIFVEPEVPSDQKFQVALEQIDLFHEVVLSHPKMKKITEWSDIERLKYDEIGAMLTLEGADAFGNDLTKLRTFYQLGVKSIGLTWNNANLCADGVGESRNGGLTELGIEVVRHNNEHFVWTDVSHLTEPGFWDVMKHAKYPIATHSNSKTVCNHRRNLTDEQAQALFRKSGFIGMVFNPPFLTGEEQAKVSDIIKHIDHFCALGGKNHIGFGSDFDGIGCYVDDLEHAGKYDHLINALLQHYSENEVKGFAYQNVLKHLPNQQ
ncbi:dipeptidase [Alteribacter populi]|uniref:dipeptidase n=1 Tax=Alteribacter populi TaxID=2011011 RepID=UPI000BBB2DC4|nr:dipeptidase [Alteribacter populi]